MVGRVNVRPAAILAAIPIEFRGGQLLTHPAKNMGSDGAPYSANALCKAIFRAGDLTFPRLVPELQGELTDLVQSAGTNRVASCFKAPEAVCWYLAVSIARTFG